MGFFSEIGSRFGSAFRAIAKGQLDLSDLSLRVQVLESRLNQVAAAGDFLYTPPLVYLEIGTVRDDGHGQAVRKKLTLDGLTAIDDDAAPYYVMGPPAHGLTVGQSGWCEYLGVFEVSEGNFLPLYTWIGREPSLWLVEIVCTGPNGEADFTDERYWVNFVTADEVDAGEAAAYELSAYVQMATNLFETSNHQHRLHVGDRMFAFDDELGRLVIAA